MARPFSAALNSLRQDPEKRAALIEQAVRFVLASAFSACLSMGTPVFLHEVLGVAEKLAVAAGLLLVFCINFYTSRALVFRSAGRSDQQLMKFFISSVVFRIAEYGAFLGLNAAGLEYYYALGIVLAISTVAKFFVLRNLVYKAG